MKLKCIKYYYDKVMQKYVDINEEIDTNKERASVLIEAGVATEIKDDIKASK